jgi:hypothetical protein
LKRDKIVYFKNPGSKKQIPNINSYPMSIDDLKYCKARICDIGTCMGLEPSKASSPKVNLVTLSEVEVLKQEMSLFTPLEV